jgi:hypothetical protein
MYLGKQGLYNKDESHPKTLQQYLLVTLIIMTAVYIDICMGWVKLSLCVMNQNYAVKS